MTQKTTALLLTLFWLFTVQGQTDDSKMNGVSYVGTAGLISEANMTPVVNVNANWITIMPFGFVASNSALVQFNQSWQWKGETSNGIKHTVDIAKKKNLKVLLKPHVWMHNGWIGELNFDNEKDFALFENSYTDYILEFAKVAQDNEVEIFCIGVELKKIAVERPAFMVTLIEKVRAIFKGKITYAANWDNYQNITFWKKLDYIGIDAYFPISDDKTPSFQSCYIGWKPHFEAMKALSSQIEKKVIFTEFGYRNIDYTGKEPWTESKNETYNSMAQINAYRAIFSRFWGESWFAGGFLWKWFPNHSRTGGTKNNRFTPQNKPVETVISQFYGKKI